MHDGSTGRAEGSAGIAARDMADPDARTTAIPLSVVVVTFRSGATLPACLAALRAASPPDAELLVVDNAGDEEVVPLVEQLWPGARVAVNGRNQGFAAAVNLGIAQARGDAILLLNPDAIVEPDAVRALRAALDALTDAGIVAPVLLDPTGRRVLSAYPFLTLGTVAWRHLQLVRAFPDRVLGRYRCRALRAREPFAVDWAQGACLLVRRAVFEQVGGLDEAYFLYAEEVDLMRRARLAGWRTYLVPAARVRHAEGTSSGQVVPLKLASHYWSKVVYFEKHHAPPARLALRALLLLDLALRMAYRAVGVVRGHPPDARQRLAAYALTMRGLLAWSTPRIVERWRALGEGAAAPRALDPGRRETGAPAAARGLDMPRPTGRTRPPTADDGRRRGPDDRGAGGPARLPKGAAP